MMSNFYNFIFPIIYAKQPLCDFLSVALQENTKNGPRWTRVDTKMVTLTATYA